MLVHMSAKAGISVAEYLHTSFPDLDREYRDGELLERNVPDYAHARTQALLIFFFEMLRQKLSLYACSELRLKLREGLYLIPDVCVFRAAQSSSVPDQPPIIAIEILTPDDRMSSVREKLDQFKAWGVAHVWLVDPHSKRMYSCDQGLLEVGVLTIPELGLEIKAAEIFE
jgi:Uma2 family endonuclease